MAITAATANVQMSRAIGRSVDYALESAAMPARLNDLFELFPDLPWSARSSRASRVMPRAGVAAWRLRALGSIRRQRAAAAAFKKRIRRQER
jgi:hypothetical protein